MRIRKNWYFSFPFFLFFILNSSFFSFDNVTKVLIDGKEIEPEGTITLKRDDTIYLECYGLQPNSSVDIEVRKLGIKWFDDEYVVNDSGQVKEILFLPEEKISVNCSVTYIDEEGSFKFANFKLKIV